jgi:RNA polymerase sigma-70 factor (ECF subfamily)
MTIARYKAMDALRSTTGERENVVRLMPTDDDDEVGLPDVADESAGPMDLLIQRVEAVRLKGCLQGLEPAQRQAIALAFYDGMTHAELSTHWASRLERSKVRRG